MLSFKPGAAGPLLCLVILSVLSLVACERPDPEESVVEAESPTATATPLPTVAPIVVAAPAAPPAPTLAPVQFFVVIVQPTPMPQVAASEGVETNEDPSGSSPNAIVVEPSPTPGPTPIPDDYYLGWVWTRGLVHVERRVEADGFGVILRDRPSAEGRNIGLVVGLGDVIVIGGEECGYSPILVHLDELLSRETPRPEVQAPASPETEQSLLAASIVPQQDTVTGWAFTEELTILGDTAITGQFGVNLRDEPCRYARNLGLIPGGANVIVTGPPRGEYTPVLVDDDVIQSPFDTSIFEPGRFYVEP